MFFRLGRGLPRALMSPRTSGYGLASLTVRYPSVFPRGITTGSNTEAGSNINDDPREANYDDAPTTSQDSSRVASARQSLHIASVWAPRIAIGGISSYILYKSSMLFSSTLLSINLTDAFYGGCMVGGFSVAGAGAAVYWYMRSFQTMRPQLVYQAAMKHLSSDDLVTKLLGPVNYGVTGIQSGIMRAYKLDGGDLGLGPGAKGMGIPSGLGADKKVVFRYPRIQMVFQVYGSAHQALCTVEAVNIRGALKFNLITLDVLTDDTQKEPVLIAGKEDRMYVRDQMTSFVALKKKYVGSDN